MTKLLSIVGFDIEKVFIHLDMISIHRLEKSTLILETEGFPVLLPTAEASDTTDKEDDGIEKEEELGIFQVLERLEELTSMLSRR
jgi:hypothetical protein